MAEWTPQGMIFSPDCDDYVELTEETVSQQYDLWLYLLAKLNGEEV